MAHFRSSEQTDNDKVSYDPPGELSKYGKRHDNDFKEISKISIIPTKEEILCDRMPFLPSSLPDAPHFLPDGAAKLLDTQFRLLREDMLNPIRESISSLVTMLSKNWNISFNSFYDNKFSSNMKPKINSDLYPLYFGVVVSRDENVLAKHTDHARIDVKFTDPSIYSIYRS